MKMNKLKSAFLFAPALSISLVSGCAQGPSTARAADAFFEAFNHLCEEDALQVTGQLSLQGYEATYTAGFTSTPQQLAVSLFFAQDKSVGFYIKDGQTYLDYFGTKSSSQAEKIGIAPSQAFHVPNPFLELTRQQREALFSSVSVEEDTYTFTFKNAEMEKFLDNYGAVDVERAVMQARLVNGNLTWMSIDVKATYDIGTQSTPLVLQGNAAVEATGSDVQITFPADMNAATWNASATPSQQDLFNQALDAVESGRQES